MALIAKRYELGGRPHLKLEDLIQEGNIALIEASRLWEPGRGVTFSTYAKYHVESRILRAVDRDRSWAIHLPDRAGSLARKVQRVTSGIRRELGRQPTLGEISARLGVDASQIEDLNVLVTQPISSFDEAEVGPDGSEGRPLGELLLSDGDGGYTETTVAQDVHEALRRLHPSKRRVLELRYGLNGYEGREHTFPEIASELDITVGWANTLHKRALEQLQTESPELIDMLYE